MKNLKNNFQNIIRYDTSSLKGVNECHSFVQNLLSSANMKTTTIYDKTTPLILWGSLPDKNGNLKGGVLFSGHLDVVPCNPLGWQTNPFEVIEKEDNWYARGACDMKGFVASCLTTIQNLKDKKLHQPVHICLSFDEEGDMLGIKKTAPLLNKHKPSWCWVGEPSSMQMINTHLGCVTGFIDIQGAPAHGSTPENGLSAIQLGMDITGFIHSLAQEKKNKPFDDLNFKNPYTVFNIGQFSGGNAPNIVADECHFSYQYRPHPQDNVEEINAQIDSFIQNNIQPQFEKFEGTGINHRRLIDHSLMAKQDEAFLNMQALLNQNNTQSATYVTEAGFMQSCGIPTIICGPGSIEQAHKNNEFVPKKDMQKCYNMMQTLGNYLCHGKNLSLPQYLGVMQKNKGNARE